MFFIFVNNYISKNEIEQMIYIISFFSSPYFPLYILQHLTHQHLKEKKFAFCFSKRQELILIKVTITNEEYHYLTVKIIFILFTINNPIVSTCLPFFFQLAFILFMRYKLEISILFILLADNNFLLLTNPDQNRMSVV